MTEQQLRAVGALPDRCSEPVSRICLMCGTAAMTAEEWRRNGNCCVICGNAKHRDECIRCRAHCESDRLPRPCGALAAFRKTGRVAFPEKVQEGSRRDADAERLGGKKLVVPKARLPKPPPPVTKTEDNPFASAWRRYIACLANYAVFTGRSNRRDVVSFLAIEFLGFVTTSLFGGGPFFLLATALPAWALAVRRLHDIGRSGQWLWLVVFFPIAVFVLPAMLAWPGSGGPNRYGPPPA